MTLFSRPFHVNRGMPTLSLKVKSRIELRFGAWGRVCVSLFLFIFVLLQLTAHSVHAQDLKNRTEEMYPFGTVIISKESLPDKVYEAQKNKILISVVFFEKETSNTIISSVGTGFVTESPGIIVTARHLLDGLMVSMEKMKNEKIKLNPKFDYDYMFIGTIITDTAWIKFPLSLVAIGEKGTLKDIMALRVDTITMERARTVGDALESNPFNVLTKTSKFVDADIGEKVYISGFAPGVTEYFNKNNEAVPVYLDLINHTFIAEIEALLPEIPGNKTGVKIIYRLCDSAEPGFSGGKVVDKDGNVIGMTIAASRERNFIYAISSKDIRAFLKDNKLK